MKPKELLVGKCIIEAEDLKLGQCYIIEEVNVGQSHSSVVVKGRSFNSICFEYFDENKEEVNIYEEYSPYKRVNKHAKYTDAEKEVMIVGCKAKLSKILTEANNKVETYEDLQRLMREMTIYVDKLVELGAKM